MIAAVLQLLSLYNREPPNRMEASAPPWNVQFSLPVKSAVTRVSGLIRSFDRNKSYGFITKTYEKYDVFAHSDDLPPGYVPRVGDYVEFDIVEDKKGLRAYSMYYFNSGFNKVLFC